MPRWPRRPTRNSDPDRRAWHRAYAAGAADEEVAAELIGSADRAQRRGGVAAAAAFWERAVALTPDPGRRAERALVAAEAKYAAGDFAATEKLLAAAEIGPLDQQGQARLERMRVQIQFGLQLTFLLNRGREAPLLLLQAAPRLQPLDAVLALETLLEALVAGMYAGRLAAGDGLAEVARVAKSVPLGPEPAASAAAAARAGGAGARRPCRRGSAAQRGAAPLPCPADAAGCAVPPVLPSG